jgi:hypothetical protein
MNQQQIKQAITGISNLLGSNPALLAKELAGLKILTRARIAKRRKHPRSE